MRRKKERSKQGQTNKQGKATQHIHVYLMVVSSHSLTLATRCLMDHHSNFGADNLYFCQIVLLFAVSIALQYNVQCMWSLTVSIALQYSVQCMWSLTVSIALQYSVQCMWSLTVSIALQYSVQCMWSLIDGV